MYQNLHLNLGAILYTFQLNSAFAIEISDTIILCVCLFLTHFEMFFNGRNTLQLRLTKTAKVRRVSMQRNDLNVPMLFNCKGGGVILKYCLFKGVWRPYYAR